MRPSPQLPTSLFATSSVPIVALTALLALVLLACGSVSGGSEPPAAENGENGSADDALTVTGTLTDEGVECPALRGDDGRLYTLAGGDLSDVSTGERIRVRGTVAEMSTCMQGITITVDSIEPVPSGNQ